MGFRGYSLCAVVGLSFSFQNCAPAFEKVDLQEKANFLESKPVFGGQAYYVYRKTRKLRSLEEGGTYQGLRQDNGGGEGSIPTIGPNGETVIPLVESGIHMPGAGAIPATAHGQTEIETVNGVIVPKNWYVPPPVVVTTTTTTKKKNNNGLMGMLGGIMGAILTTVSTSSSSSSGGNSSSGSGPTIVTDPTNGPTSGACGDYRNADGSPFCSPLLIAFEDSMVGRHSLELTDPVNDGVWFDVAGSKSWPTPYSLKKISWHRNANYMFIVLPKADGSVSGIDQLFGDSTLGPDGKTSKNGYEALAKWDAKALDGKTEVGPRDFVITREDPIFSELRLWSDRNFDAVATGDELLTLPQMGIDLIDLRYDGSYIEVDQYGNYTTFKSVARDVSGNMHLVFDLWFHVQD